MPVRQQDSIQPRRVEPVTTLRDPDKRTGTWVNKKLRPG